MTPPFVPLALHHRPLGWQEISGKCRTFPGDIILKEGFYAPPFLGLTLDAASDPSGNIALLARDIQRIAPGPESFPEPWEILFPRKIESLNAENLSPRPLITGYRLSPPWAGADIRPLLKHGIQEGRIIRHWKICHWALPREAADPRHRLEWLQLWHLPRRRNRHPERKEGSTEERSKEPFTKQTS